MTRRLFLHSGYPTGLGSLEWPQVIQATHSGGRRAGSCLVRQVFPPPGFDYVRLAPKGAHDTDLQQIDHVASLTTVAALVVGTLAAAVARAATAYDPFFGRAVEGGRLRSGDASLRRHPRRL